MKPYKPSPVSLLKAVSAKHKSKFAALPPVMMTAAEYLKKCSGSIKKACLTSIPKML
jgi:hypothetical protein